ncbi:GntR family transcriptional regulator [Streptomyces fulvoviolaceus]|uniref:GntR family transcriptional regulator n=1 Tax=Streptomyces fulvoviolaceus TaxID=285535 RepID=UPI0004CC258D|nr:GntR family transcriptional regulator [Streptomyces fulvoviolaceus]MCT9081137.1 GntR family transcriptional regulator [Streptomyces fulvoviolaceus]
MVDIPEGYGPNDELDPEAADPLYLQLAAVLISRIKSGAYPLGRSVPGVDRLMQEFGLARGTARKTLVLLAEQGYVRTVIGKGSFVIERAAEDQPTDAAEGDASTNRSERP